MIEKKDTRTEILNAALDMVQRQSISGVSFQELAKKVGIKKGSMYYHFESKDDLSVAMLETTREALKQGFEKGLHLEPEIRLRNFFVYYRKYASISNKICPAGSYAGEWETQSDAVKKAVQGIFEELQTGLEQIVSDGVKADDFNTHNQTIETIAQWIISNQQGALITSRVLEDSAPFDNMKEIVVNYLTQK